MMTITTKSAAMLVAFGCVLSSLAQDVRPPASVARKTVEWTPGVCPIVTDGDVLAFEWNPAFENQASVSGIREVNLRLARRGEEASAVRIHTGLALTANPYRNVTGVDAPLTQLPNGFYQIRLLVVTHSAEPGEYHLVDAQFVPALADTFQGLQPQMTNSPIRYQFCVNVLATPSSHRQPHPQP